jgi:hypothetical protein
MRNKSRDTILFLSSSNQSEKISHKLGAFSLLYTSCRAESLLGVRTHTHTHTQHAHTAYTHSQRMHTHSIHTQHTHTHTYAHTAYTYTQRTHTHIHSHSAHTHSVHTHNFGAGYMHNSQTSSLIVTE